MIPHLRLRLATALAFSPALLLGVIPAASALSASPARCEGALVLRVAPSSATLVVSANPIPGVRPAGVLVLRAAQPAQLALLRPGDIVNFTLAASPAASSSRSRLVASDLRAVPYVSSDNDPSQAARLAILSAAVNPAAAPPLTLGARVPDFTLTDQTGRKARFSQFAGRVRVLDFVYTHCPLPNYCFRLSDNLFQLQRRFRSQLGRNLVLLTITLDPTHDTPPVLARYAQIWRADPATWLFLTGPAPRVRSITSRFGANSWQAMGMDVHSLHTVLIDRRGRVFANLEGNEFTGRQLGDLVATLLR